MAYISKYKQKRIDYATTVAEEITLMTGLKTTMDDETIVADTLVGSIKFSACFNDLMQDVYRFYYVYGGRLQTYGVEQRIKHGEYERSTRSDA